MHWIDCRINIYWSYCKEKDRPIYSLMGVPNDMREVSLSYRYHHPVVSLIIYWIKMVKSSVDN